MKIIITGSASGIGRFLAQQLGAAGHEIWGIGLTSQEDFQRECAARNISFRWSVADVADWARVSAARREVGEAWPHLDALICCAGVQGALGPAMTLDPEEWSRGLRVNLDGVFYSIRAFHDLLEKHAVPRAKILCLSGGGATAPRLNFSSYAAAKAAVVRLVENLAHEWAGATIDINAIAPGGVNTGMTQEVLNLGPEIVGEKEYRAAQAQKQTGGSPLPRVAEMVGLLLSPASDNVSGRLLSLPWDAWEKLPQLKQELAGTDIFTLRRVVPEDRGKAWSPRRAAAAAAASTPLKIVVAGLWHLGSVTAACCARHFQVTGLDFDPPTIARLNEGKAPLFEPGLDDLIGAGIAQQRLRFSDDPKTACAGADVLWLTEDTPVDDQDVSDVAAVLEKLRRCLPHLPAGALVLVSSQLPVGTCRKLEAEFPQFHFACVPENLRLGRAIDAFEKAERFVVGLRTDAKKAVIETLLGPFAPQVLFMRTESAEMVKHALNSFLGVSITFINEIARLCERAGADAKEVSLGLKSDARIGPRSYLGPGGPFAGGTLARDVVTLSKLASEAREQVFVLPAIKCSNDEHRGWAFRKLQSRLGELRGQTIAVLGLVYTPNTDTLRRSAAVELSRQLLSAGARVQAFDPAVQSARPELASIPLLLSLAEAVRGADAAVVCTEWPVFRQGSWAELARTMHQPVVVVDPNRFLEAQLKGIPGVEHLSVGRPS
jgi:UDPglucose 6-dehydrogenase